MLVVAGLMIAAQAGAGGMPGTSFGPPPMIQIPPSLPTQNEPPPPATKTPHKGAQPINFGEVFASDNYPFWASQIGDQGSVKFRLSIDPAGRVTDCTIVVPSRHATLNQPTCDLILARARFSPATDRRGRGVATSYSRQVRWTMPPPAPSPVRDQFLRVVFGLDAAGATWCRTEALPGATIHPRTCDNWRASPLVRDTVGMAALSLEPADRTRWDMVVEQRSLVGAGAEVIAAARAIGAAPGEGLQNGMISRLTISPAGAVTGCSYIDPGDLTEELQQDSCARAKATRFEGSEAGGERVMIVVSAVYYRRR